VDFEINFDQIPSTKYHHVECGPLGRRITRKGCWATVLHHTLHTHRAHSARREGCFSDFGKDSQTR